MKFQHRGHSYDLDRYPPTTQRSLQAWSAADEHILRYLDEHQLADQPLVIAHDRFGFLACLLHASDPFSVLTYQSQEKSIRKNLSRNQLTVNEERWLDPLSIMSDPLSLAVLKIPKSLDLFQLYLQQLAASLREDGQIVCGFMTRHFSPQLVKIAEQYFTEVQQSQAWKKSRLLILKGKKALPESSLIESITLDNGQQMQSYPGVFSTKGVDIATRFLIDHLRLREQDQNILDLGAGYGILAKVIRDQAPEREIHLLDDSWLAMASARLNLTDAHSHFHYDDTLDGFAKEQFDFVVSNPPYHFEHENNIDIALSLFQAVKRCLKADGHFQLVANQHLNYKTHLMRMFIKVEIVAENERFVIYDCSGKLGK